jgi:hypothetical protein
VLGLWFELQFFASLPPLKNNDAKQNKLTISRYLILKYIYFKGGVVIKRTGTSPVLRLTKE